MQVTLQYATEHFADIVSAVESGEEITIAKAGRPTVKLIPVTPFARRSRKEMRGSAIGKLEITANTFSPAGDAEVQELFDSEAHQFDCA